MQKTTICPLVDKSGRQRATEWVKAAQRSGRYRFVEGDGDFPKHVWYRADGFAWSGLRVNGSLGQYKGWPLEDDDPDAHRD